MKERYANIVTTVIATVVAAVFCYCVLSMVPRPATACDNAMARQVADLLVANNITGATRVLDAFDQQQPGHAMLGLYRGAVLWAHAQNATKQNRDAAQQRAITAMRQVVEQQLTALRPNPAQPKRLLAVGMAQAFIARLYLQRKKWFKAYRYGRKARDNLRALIEKYLGEEDAYLILGFYEYHAGSVPAMWKWFTALIDLSGDVQRGIRYIERAVQHAPVVAPEAARVLLTEINRKQLQVCDYLSLAQHMREHYGSNPQFSMVLQDFYISCGQPQNALTESQRAKDQYLTQFPDMAMLLDIRQLAAYRELGDMRNVLDLASRLTSAPYIGTLNKAKTADLLGERLTARYYYQQLLDDDHAPNWARNQAQKYLEQPYQRIEPRTLQRELKLNAGCR